MSVYREIYVKSAINSLKFIDSWFWCRYTLNPYRGCEHGCIYCDSRSKKYYLHQDLFETVYVKKNLNKVLKKRLEYLSKPGHSWGRDVIAIGGTCDAYQPAERTYRITENILNTILRYKFPVIISTKSILIQRDLGLLNKIGSESWCTVGLTITTPSDRLALELEPRAPPSSERFKTLAIIKVKYKHIIAGINLIPIIPFLEDDLNYLEEIIKKAAEYKADFVLFSPGLTLRDVQEEYFFSILKKSHPEIVGNIKQLYGIDNSRGRNNLNEKSIQNQDYDLDYAPKWFSQISKPVHLNDYMKYLNKFLYDTCNKYKIKMRVPRWTPNDYRRVNYIISEELLNDFYYASIDPDSKKIFKEKYKIPAKKVLQAALILQNLKNSVRDLIDNNTLKTKIMNEAKIYGFNLSPYISQIIEIIKRKLESIGEKAERKMPQKRLDIYF
ncbi:MAG: radical SAM protein [Promethearchaeota archaeon]